jgi:large conductance mechanosensitive channel
MGHMLKGFRDFVLRGNVVDLAVAVVIGAAFTAVVTSFVNSFLTPLIALIGGGGKLGGRWEVNGQFFTWGAFLSAVIGFLLTAAVVYFLVVLPVHRLLARVVGGDEPLPVGPTEIELLVEIRDLLRAQSSTGMEPLGGLPRSDVPGPYDR